MIGGLLKSASSTALFAALGIIALSAGVPAAKAADLGGDCCADLEERVAELEATTARKGNRRVSLTISGQVATGIMAWDNGDDSDVYITDNTFSAGGTGVRFSGSAAISPNLTAGFEIALGISAGARSHFVDEDNDDGREDGDSQFRMTRGYWYLNHRQLGRLSVGRINTATAGATTVNLGGTNVVANASIGYWQRSFTAIGTGESWNTLMGGSTVTGSSLSRANAVSYSSPTFGGFSVSAAAGEDNIWDAALRYAGEFSGFRLAGAVGYAHNTSGLDELLDDDDNGDEHNQVKGSLSLMHVGSGLYLTGAFVDQEAGDVSGGGVTSDTTLYYVQGGISKNWTGLGNTAFYGEYANTESEYDIGGIPDEAETDMWGLGVVQHIDAAAMEVYLSYRNFSGEYDVAPGGAPSSDEAEDFDVIMSGARIRF